MSSLPFSPVRARNRLFREGLKYGVSQLYWSFVKDSRQHRSLYLTSPSSCPGDFVLLSCVNQHRIPLHSLIPFVTMILFLVPIIVGILAEGVLSGGHGYRDQSSCDSACFSGFTDIPGIASLCNNANRPTKTIEVSVTVLTTSIISM